MSKILFINACVRKESRTLALAREIVKQLHGEITEVNLEREQLAPLTEQTLSEREALLKNGEYGAPMLRYARQFAEADEIVIAAPYWDLGFPALLKCYIEQICAIGVTFAYPEGKPQGLCRARRLSYVTTAGGKIVHDFGYAYVKALANTFFGIGDTVCFRAEDLDYTPITAENVVDAAAVTVIK